MADSPSECNYALASKLLTAGKRADRCFESGPVLLFHVNPATGVAPACEHLYKSKSRFVQVVGL